MWWDLYRYPGIIGHALAPTLSDVRRVTFEGPVGLLRVIPPELLYKGSVDEAYNATDKEILFANGSRILGFATTEEGNRLRGPQCHILTGDEIAAWNKPAGNLETAFNNAMFGCRLPYPDGRLARAYFATTPRPIPFMTRLEARKDVKVITGSTRENARNLSSSFLNTILAVQGTSIGKQEIEGEYIDIAELGIFKRAWFPLWPNGKELPEFSFIIESYDTAFSDEEYDSKKQERDPTACIVVGVFNVLQQFDEKERKRLGIRSKYAALLCEAWQDWLGFPELLDKARKQHRIKWGTPGRRSDLVLIEEKSSGADLRKMLNTYSIPTWPYNPHNTSKTLRAHAVSPLIQQKMLFIPESGLAHRVGLPRNWVEPFLEQVTAFAGEGSVEHDDFVDALDQVMLYLRDNGILEIAPAEAFVDLEEKREAEEREALRIQASTGKRESPYGS